jgi:FkbM family methyltransferase
MIDLRLALPADSSFGRLLRLPLKLIPSNAVVPILSGPLKGAKWVSGAGNHGCWLGTYELATQQRIVREAGACGMAFDLGANHGFFTMLLAHYSKLVIAVEPFAPNISVLERHLAINGIKNCKIVRAAAAGENGTAFFAQGTNHATGRICPAGAIEVNTVSLEELVTRFGPASVIKVDVEGAELEVLTGGASYLKEYRPKLFVSTHGREIREECERLLRSLGFTFQLHGSDLFAW